MAQIECDVLIVGGGPTGATLALLLARRGVNAIVVDKEADIYPLPRAAHIDHEVMRIFQELGIAGEIEATCRHTARYDFLNANGEVLLRFDGADRIGPGGWRGANMIHQPSIEALLRREIAKHDGATLKTSWRLEGFEESSDGVVSTISTPEGVQVVRSAHVVGADGARSLVREASGIEVDDLQFDEPWLVIDAIVHDASRLPQINLQICDPSRPTTCVLMGAGRHRWEFMLRPEESPEEVSEDACIAALLAPWNVEGAITIERKAVYRFSAKVAKHWRKGRVSLAGDAAHLMPPFAGQGMCSGIRDAANLAWKLAATLRGADERLLDSYQVEREPHVRQIIRMAMMMGKTVCITDPGAAAQRDQQMLAARAAGSSLDGAPDYPPMQEGVLLAGSPGAGMYFPQPFSAAGGALRLDDVLGEGPWLISRDAPTGPGQHLKCVALSAKELAPFRARLEDWMSAHNADAVLVRADRYVFGTGAPEALNGAWREWLP